MIGGVIGGEREYGRGGAALSDRELLARDLAIR